MAIEDKNLTCKDCSKEFVWSAGEQQFYADKGLQNPPGRCPDCRKQRKDKTVNRQMYKITCKNCGQEGEVPFEPRNPNDVLCAECFKASKQTEDSTPKNEPEEVKTPPEESKEE